MPELMTAPRFFYPFGLSESTTITLPDQSAHHARRVLRLREASAIILFNGQGGQYPATIHFEGKRATARLGPYQDHEVELPGKLRLLQALAGGEKMDWIIEKAVELGVTAFQPVAAERSIMQLRDERLHKRMQHWQRIIFAASAQCGRNRLMQLEPLDRLDKLLPPLASHGHKQGLFICHPEYGTPLSEALGQWRKTPATTLNLLIGPEGGWSDDELAMAQHHGAEPVQFGQRVLRTETAGLALAAASIALLGWDKPAT